MDPQFELVESLSDLDAIASKLSTQKLLAIDIEADSLHHYFPKVCLIQVSTTKQTFIIDPLAIQTVKPLHQLLERKDIKKLFHGADFDLRSLFRDYSIKVNNIFDTMIGSQFLGEKEPGLAAVLKKRFDVDLNKQYQKANWSKRPLSHDMLAYAAHDTTHLFRLYSEVKQELSSKERLGWVEEECKRLSVVCTTTTKPSPAGQGTNGQILDNTPLFIRFSGAGAMTPRDLAVLERLLRFRDRRAMEQDKPPFKIFGNVLIKELVKEKPTEHSELKKLRRLPRNFMKRYAKGTLAAIKTGLAIQKDHLPSYPKIPRPPKNLPKQARLKKLKKWRKTKASQLEIYPGLICNNNLLNTLAEKNPAHIDDLKEVTQMRIWQMEVFGKEIVDVLSRSET